MSLKVFLVEDSAVIRHRLDRMLAGIPGLEVAGTAPRLEGLLETLAAVQPDVVLLDVRLPDGLGLDVVTAIRQLEIAPHIFIVTSHGEPPYRMRAEALQVDGFFDKADELEALCHALGDLAASQGVCGGSGSV